MPRRRSFTFLIAAAVLALGCGSSDSSSPLTTGNNSSSRTMKATYNGVAFNPTLMIVKNAGGASTLSLVGTFDIKFP